MQIECPGCKKGNNLNLEQVVRCGHCQVELTGHNYKKTKRAIGAIVAALFLGAAGHNALSSDDRYPIVVEYDLVQSCLEGSQSALRRSQYELKKEDCICALRAVQPEFSLGQIRSETQQFLSAFGGKATQCRASRTGWAR
ncbi:MAG: hypothetical protein ACRBBM_16060 [Pseudomonadaceae bacterium]